MIGSAFSRLNAHTAVATPLPSRAPVVARTHVVWLPAQRRRAATDVAAALAPALSGAREWSALVLAGDGSVLYSDRAAHPVAPASAQKLIVADAALTEWGPQYRFVTLFASERPVDGNALNGDLWVAMSGDPSLRSTDLWQGVTALRARGIASIDGRVVVDPSAIDGEEINPLWNAEDANEDFMAATSGASIDDDTVEFRITGTQDGSDARVVVWPPSTVVTYSGSIATGGGDDVTIGGTDTPNTFRLSGDIPAGVTERFWLPVHGIPQYTASVVSQLLKRAAIAVTRAAETGTVPVDATPLWTHRSHPLRDLVHHMLVESDNHYAEQFMRLLGGVDGAAPDDRSGIEAERHMLISQAIPVAGLHLVDGSGLAHADRVPAQTLAGILEHFEQMPVNALYPLLPRGGKEGTLKTYTFTDAAGRVRAKSGHLSDASSLAGYVDTRSHGRVVFAFMINGSPGDPDTAITRAVDALARL